MRLQLAMTLMSLALIVGAELEGQSLRLTIARTSSGVDWIHPPPSAHSSRFEITGASSNSDRRGLAVSLSGKKSLARWFALESGLQVIAKGFEVTGPTFHMQYAEVPLIGVLQIGRDVGLFVEGGVVAGLRVRCRRFFEAVDGFHEDGCGTAMTSYGSSLAPLRRSDLSWLVGVGGRMALGQGQMVFTARRQRSLIDIQPAVPNEKMVNRVHILALGYELEIW